MSPKRAMMVRDWLTTPVMDLIVRVVALVSLAVAGVVGIQQIRLNSCVERYINANNAVSQQRAEAADTDRKALDLMVASIVSASGAPSAGRAVSDALSTYLQTRAVADRQRANSPLPQPPSATC